MRWHLKDKNAQLFTLGVFENLAICPQLLRKALQAGDLFPNAVRKDGVANPSKKQKLQPFAGSFC
ncbi:hypothetical protein A2797_01690 [candidate division WWE3 bacterium RIFCSPHIGHO2_01_FULL_48_15]|uniref:Uncharacterized protein n=1 Tax=candidate division WWE3 bacterium RIFCSPHIGHO2_01_FULL_48_15 TaxID=1802619 RepID=A0A1F4VBH9_UNCKA|nr:MAG: hypothetical protein A2797_01690 [candidate division WWE3 bacterium RIFCSPHIGHO2_01_FULL_48_15]